jgi:benzoyl-CoA 2,3-dioxygenase component B
MIDHFGETGKTEAQKQLQRRSYNQERLLGSFNEPVDHWLDFFVYTHFVDRDGKYQLKMLGNSAFQPLGESMGPMLKEESFHLGTGYTGLARIIRAGKVPVEVMQRYYNKWIPTAFDLFGKDRSSTAAWSYVWGLKSRYNEFETDDPLDKDELNGYNRGLYRAEITAMNERHNELIKNGGPKLVIPSDTFNRGIGAHEGQCFTVEGEPIERNDYKDYLKSVLPTKDDKSLLQEVFEAGDWIAPKGGAS